MPCLARGNIYNGGLFWWIRHRTSLCRPYSPCPAMGGKNFTHWSLSIRNTMHIAVPPFLLSGGERWLVQVAFCPIYLIIYHKYVIWGEKAAQKSSLRAKAAALQGKSFGWSQFMSASVRRVKVLLITIRKRMCSLYLSAQKTATSRNIKKFCGL